MKFFKNLKLKSRIVLMIGLVVFISFSLTIGIVFQKSEKMEEESSNNYLNEVARRNVLYIQAGLEIAQYTAENIALTFEGLKNSGELPQRNTLNEILKQVLEETPELRGIWTGWEPNALDNRDEEYANSSNHDETGRFVPYWYRDKGKIGLSRLKSYKNKTGGLYYKIPVRTGKPAVLEPYLYDIEGKKVLLTSFCVPIKFHGKVVGAVGADMALTSLTEGVSKIRFFDEGYITIISNKGNYISHPILKRIGQPVLETSPDLGKHINDIENGRKYTVGGYSSFLNARVKRIGIPVYIGETKTPWSIVINAPVKSVFKNVTELKWVCFTAFGVSMILLIFALLIVVKKITDPILEGISFTENMASGDLTKELTTTRSDEVGSLMTSLNSMSIELRDMIKNIGFGVETLSDASTELASTSSKILHGSEVSSVKTSSVAAAAEEMSTGMDSVSKDVESASQNVSMVAAACEEMTSSIDEVSKNTAYTRSVSEDAVEKTRTASETMSRLGVAASEINKVTETINNISDQTHLLALNATIEAARAGEAGKGFNVVAMEIKELASLTSEATEEIQGKIQGIQNAAEVSVNVISEISDIIDKLSDIAGDVAAAVEQQSCTIHEIAGNASKVSANMDEINNNVLNSVKASVAISSDIADVNTESEGLKESSSLLGVNAENLLGLSKKLDELTRAFIVK